MPLVQHRPGKKPFAKVGEVLQSRGSKVGTIVDATTMIKQADLVESIAAALQYIS